MVHHVTTLKFDETVRLDPDKLGTLYCQLGEAGAESVVCRAMEELSGRLQQLRRIHAAGKLEEMARVARGLVGIADQIGMTKLATIAGHVAACATQNDTAAVAATLERLERVSDQSLNAIWDLQGLSG